ncbi:sialate O-acetylesterase [Vibrio alginolyticus]
MSNFPDLIAALDDAVEALKVKLSQDVSKSTTYNGELIQSLAKDVEDRFSAIQALVQGRVTFATKADMDADLAHLENTLAEVWNDPNPDLNGLYGKIGESGVGSWIESTYDVAKQAYDKAITNAKNFLALQDSLLDDEINKLDGAVINVEDATASNNITWVEASPVASNCLVKKVHLNVKEDNTTVSIKVYERVGDTGSFTLIERVLLGVLNAGDHTVDVNLFVLKGMYLGHYASNGLKLELNTESLGFYVTSGDADDFTDTDNGPAPNGSRIGIQWDGFLLKPDQNAKAISENQNEIQNNKDQLDKFYNDSYEPLHYLGTKSMPADGQNLPSGGDWVVGVAATEDKILSLVRCGSVTVDNSEFKVRVYSKAGDTFTVEREAIFTASIGLNEFNVNLPIKQGEYVGIKIPSNAANYSGTGAISYPLYYGNAINVGNTFVDASATNLAFHWEFLTQEPMVKSHSERLEALEQTMQTLPFEFNMILGVGQSLMEGAWTSLDLPSQAPITTQPEYDTLGWQGGVDNNVLQPADVDTTQIGSRGEWSGLGCASFLKVLLSKKKGIPTDTEGNTLVVTNEGSSGASIQEISKGGSRGRFEVGISKATNLSALTSSNSGALAVIFMQGESDQAGDLDVYKADLAKLASDYNTDLKAATGQTLDVNLFSYQLSTYRRMSLAHLEASESNSNIILASPIYHLSYYDSLHIDAQSERLMGAYFAKAIYQTCVVGVPFEPLKPIDVHVVGNDITITFNKSGLVLDNTLVPEQVNYGFSVKDGAISKTINAVAVKNRNQIKLSMSEVPNSGWVIEYGVPVQNKAPQAGVCGNLRDNDGAEYSFDGHPLHNWSVIFDFEI